MFESNLHYLIKRWCENFNEELCLHKKYKPTVRTTELETDKKESLRTIGLNFLKTKALQIDHCIERRLYKGVRCVMKIFYKCLIQWMRCSAVQVLRNQYIWQSKVTNKQKVSRQEGSNESPGSEWGRKISENEWEKREKICLSAWIKII